ncbi:signal peptidase II [Patulibacter americanus]|uniref:signal peptidase II n=1 Tax=Patulibacter americanus TaxID=588672 RepID=UPI000A03F95D|nr:signal peptidase II [Patulibacter americanus]
MSRDEARAGRLANRRVLAVAVVVLILDQLTKRLAVEAVPRGTSEQFLPLIDLVHVRNEGVAFSSFAGQPWIVGLLVVAALAALTWWFLRNRTVRFAWLAAGMLAGGAIGNVLDRIIEGAVIDFLKPPNWPAFNLADMAIVGGMALLVIVVELENRRTTAGQRHDARPQRG